MKRFKLIIVALLLATTSVNAQAQNEDEQYEMTRTYASINTSLYVKAMNLMFRLDTLSADDVLITRIDGNKTKNKYVTRSEIRTYLCKQYYKPDQKRFKLTAETNNGYVLVIGQYGKDADIPLRFFTLFIDQLSGKINVIEIEENK